MLPVLARIGPITIGTHDFLIILGLALYYPLLIVHFARQFGSHAHRLPTPAAMPAAEI
jgi:hypothetical protein